jgi:altronate dehydratase small subunit
MDNRVNSILIHVEDDVATALVELAPGDTGSFIRQGRFRQIAIAQRIPQYHKYAIRDLRRCDPVHKYGEIIGDALQDIRSGSHVHVHNIAGPERSRA